MPVAIAVVVLVLSSVLIFNWWYHSQADTSWVDDVSQLLQKAHPIPNVTEQNSPNALFSYCRTYLYENGTSELVEYGNTDSTNPISTYLNSLLLKANLQLQSNGSVSTEFLDRVLAKDKVVAIVYRLSTLNYGEQQRFYTSYFVLRDNLNEDLLGKFVLGKIGKQGYSLWATLNFREAESSLISSLLNIRVHGANHLIQ